MRFRLKIKGKTACILAGTGVAIGLVVPISPSQAGTKPDVLSQTFTVSSTQKAKFSLNLSKGQKLRLVGSSNDANSSSVYLDATRPDGSNFNSFASVKSTGAGVSATTIGPMSQSGTYQFTLSSLSGSSSTTFNLQAFILGDPIELKSGQTIELDFDRAGAVPTFYIDANAGTKYRLVTLSTQNNSSVYANFLRPDGTSNTFYSLRSSGPGNQAVDFTPAQNGKYSFDPYFSTASDTGKVRLTLVEIKAPSAIKVGSEIKLDFSKQGARSDFSVHLTKGYTYRFITSNSDQNGSSVYCDYVRPDGTSNSFFSLRYSGAGTAAENFGPAAFSGVYIFSAYHSDAGDTSNVSLTIVRIEKPTLLRTGTSTELNFTYPGQAFSFAVPVNKDDRVQIQSDAGANLSTYYSFARPDGTSNSFNVLRYDTAGRQLDTNSPSPYSQTGFYIFTFNLAKPANVGKVSISFLGSTNFASNYVSDLPDASEDGNSQNVSAPIQTALPTVTPSPKTSVTPKATATPRVTKSEEAISASQAPSQSELMLSTTESDIHDSSKVQIIYNGNLMDKNSKPVGFRFYIKQIPGSLEEISRVIALDDATCSQLSKNKFKCSFPNFNPYQSIKIDADKTGASISVSAYNLRGESPRSESVNMFASMLKQTGFDWDLLSWDKVTQDVYGTGLKNWLGFRSRSSSSKLTFEFIMSGKIPTNYTLQGDLISVDSSGKRQNIPFNITKLKAKGDVYVFGLNSINEAEIRGDSNYIAKLKIIDSNFATRGSGLINFSLDYQMNLKCSASLFAAQTIRDASKGSLKTLQIVTTTLELFIETSLKKTPLIKYLPSKARKEVFKKIQVLGKYSFAAGVGYDLIDIAAAAGTKDKVEITTTVKGIIKERASAYVIEKIDEANGTTTLRWELDAVDAAELGNFLATQGAENGQNITNSCS